MAAGIAAYKSLFLIRLLAKRGIATQVILTRGGSEFVTALSAGALSGERVFGDLWNLDDEAHQGAETKMGHIELSRSADLIVVAPATADLMAKAAHGIANDLASTTLLATDKRVLFVPSMNVRMWEAPATQRNTETLRADGQYILGPDEGEMACGEFGLGRMSEPEAIADAVENLLTGDMSLDAGEPLAGRRAVVSAGPTREAIDPVRYLSNHSSGKQGYAVASALRALGAEVVLVSGPVNLPAPVGVKTVLVNSAREMLSACESAVYEGGLPADIFIGVAAVADWHVKNIGEQKIKKNKDGLKKDEVLKLDLVKNPDILKTIATSGTRPNLVIGFAAETHDVVAHAKAKLTRKKCDWVIANDVSGDVMGGDYNEMIIVSDTGAEAWPRMSKTEAAQKLAARIANYFGKQS